MGTGKVRAQVDAPPLFCVFNRDGKPMMSTSQESCIYDDAILLNMLKAGYRFEKHGKPWRPSAAVKKKNT